VSGSATRETPAGFGEVLRVLWSKPAFRQLLVGGALASCSNTAISLFLHAHMVRSYHLTQAQAGYLFGVLALGTISIGALLGGYGADRGMRRDARWLAWLPALGWARRAVVCHRVHAESIGAALLLVIGSILVFFYTHRRGDGLKLVSRG
jgi:MFS family permease